MKYYKNVDNLLSLKKFKDSNIKANDLSQIQIRELNKIIKNMSSSELRNRYENIINFIHYDVDDTISWFERLRIIKNDLKNDSSSLYSFVIRYGKEKGELKYNEKINKTKPDYDNLIKTHGKEKAKNIWNRRYKNVGNSLENYISVYGEKLGKLYWDRYLKKRNKTYIRNKNNGRKYNNGRSLNEYISRYGDEEGKKLWVERNKKQSYRFSKKYYIKNYGKKIGLEKWNEYKASMSKCTEKSYIERYGEEEGKKLWNEFIKEKQYRNSLEYFISKYGEEGEKLWNEYRDKTIFKIQKYSKISQELFWMIYNELPVELKKECFFAELNNEWFIRTKDKTIFADFKIKNIIIEFDGDYWHSLDETIKKDKIKDKIYQNRNLDVLRIPEKKYLKNKKGIVNKCIDFINKNINNYE